MKLLAKGRVAFKRLERDEELRARIRAAQKEQRAYFFFGDEITTARGESLDLYAEKYGVRRRIIEDIA